MALAKTVHSGVCICDRRRRGTERLRLPDPLTA
jgi:hypothetical protein